MVQITGDGLLKLVKALPQLRFFDLQNCVNVGDDFVAELPKVAKNIDFLQVLSPITELPKTMFCILVVIVGFLEWEVRHVYQVVSILSILLGCRGYHDEEKSQ